MTDLTEKNGILTFTQNRAMIVVICIIAIAVAILVPNFANFNFSDVISYVPFLFGIAGIIGLIKWKRTSISFNKSTNYVEKLDKTLFNKNQEKYALNLITQVEYSEHISNHHSSKGSKSSIKKEINLIFNNGARFNIFKDSQSASLLNFLLQSKREIAQKIADFIGVPMIGKTPKDALNAVKNTVVNAYQQNNVHK